MSPTDVRPYPFDAFHLNVQDALKEVHSYVQSPDALVGMAFLTTMSVACQGLIDVRLPNGLVRPVSQNILTLAESGERKSAVDSLTSSPIYDYDERRILEHERALEKYKHELSFWNAIENGIRRRITKTRWDDPAAEMLRQELMDHESRKPVKPKLRRIMRQNSTERAVMDALHGDGESIAFMSDEGDVLLKGGAMHQIGLRNKGWDGARILTFDRVDATVIARNPRVTMSLMVQAAVLREFLERRGAVTHGSGHWARYLVGWPASTQGSRYVWGADVKLNFLPSFHERVTELLEDYGRMIDSGNVHRTVLEFSDEAKLRWVEMANTTESMIKPWGELNDIRDFASKAMEIVGRIAAIFHWFSKQDGKISVDTLQRALNVVEWHLWEFKRIFSPNGRAPQEQIDAESLHGYLEQHCWHRGFMMVSRNEVLRNGPVRPERRLAAALEVLVQSGKVRVEIGEKRKRFIVRGTSW